MAESRPDLAPPPGCKYPDANVLVHGFDTPIPRIPENAQTVMEREGMYFHTLNPRNYLQAWLADDVAKMTLRIERCARIERRERDRICLRAEFFWDDDRRIEAHQLADRLADDPAGTVEQLRRTSHGCDWLIGRWGLLANEIARGRDWTEDHVAIAHDLLGTDPAFRADAPGHPLAPADLAAREIADLRARRLAVADADKLDRALAMADMAEQSTPELRRLRRHENALHKRMRWSLHQIQVEPRHFRPNPSLQYLYEPEPPVESPSASIVTPTVQPPAEPEAKAEPEPEPEPESDPVMPTPPGPARRPEPHLLRERARREARKRRADRLDN